MSYMAHDPISILKNEKYYVGHNIYTDFLGTVSGEKVLNNYGKAYNKEASFTFTKRYVKIKGVKICNEDNECWNAGLEGKFKLVNKKPN